MTDQFALHDYHQPDYGKRKRNEEEEIDDQVKWSRQLIFDEEWEKIEEIIDNKSKCLHENTMEFFDQFFNESLITKELASINKIPVGIMSISKIDLMIFYFNY